jgi:hypothetical protein
MIGNVHELIMMSEAILNDIIKINSENSLKQTFVIKSRLALLIRLETNLQR